MAGAVRVGLTLGAHGAWPRMEARTGPGGAGAASGPLLVPITEDAMTALPQQGSPGERPGAISASVAAVTAVFGLGTALLLGLLIGNGGRMPSFMGGNAPGMMAATPGAPKVTRLDMTAKEFTFSPAKITIDAPGELTVNLANKGVVEHDIVFEGMPGRALAAAGKDASATFMAEKAGTFTYFCSIPGHRDAGMVGVLTVGGGTAAQGLVVAPSVPLAVVPGAIPVVAPAPAPAPAVPQVMPAIAGVGALPVPAIALPIGKRPPMTLKMDLESREVVGTLADGSTYTFWTYAGSVPGPMLRARQGDTVEFTFRNAATSVVTHSIDLHAVTGPGGGAKATQVPPGGQASFSFQALNPGVYVYHCATPMVAHHISNGMYGLIVVEPPEGLAPVDREFYVMQGDIYTKGDRGQAGHQEFSLGKMLDENASYVVFNGSVGAVTGSNALKARVGERVRIFFGVGGPNVTSSFHVIGEIFDRVHPEGASEAFTNVQTTMVPAGGATIVEFTVEVPGTYALVDHSLGRLEKGAAGHLVVEGPEAPGVFRAVSAGTGGSGGH